VLDINSPDIEFGKTKLFIRDPRTVCIFKLYYVWYFDGQVATLFIANIVLSGIASVL